MMATLISPVLFKIYYNLSPFLYFNLLGVAFVGMLAVFKLECRLLGLNPLKADGVPLSPEVRTIIIRVAGWFKRHQNVTPLAVFGLFLLFVGVVEGLGPEMNSIKNPLEGFVLAIGALGVFMFPVSIMGIVYHSAIWPQSSSVTEIVGLIEKVGEDGELTPTVIESASKRKVDPSPNFSPKASYAVLALCFIIMEVLGSGILSLKQEMLVTTPIAVVMAGYVMFLCLYAVFSKRRSILDVLLRRK